MPSKHNENFKSNFGQYFNLLDGASGDVEAVYKAVDEQRKIAADGEFPLEERIASYEDIIDSEVGDTSMVRARNIEREFGFRQLYLKFEGGNPTGTQKDRIAFMQVIDAMRRGFDTITLATCGNYGVAVAMAASMGGVRCQVFIPRGYHTRRINEMRRLGAQIEWTDGDYEAAVNQSSRWAEEKELYDANPGGSNTTLQLSAYGEIAKEIFDELRDAPKVVAAPVSNGTTLAGIHKGFLSLYRRGKTSKIPCIVAGSSYRKNPIVTSIIKGLSSCEDLHRDKIQETAVNEPLINWHSIDGDHALKAIQTTNGWAVNASDKRMIMISRLIREKEGLQVLPASTAGLIALLERHKQNPLPPERYVAVLTGRKA
jgi:threonine synthase